MNIKDFYVEVANESKCTQKSVKAVFEGILSVMKRNFEKGESVKFPGVCTIAVTDVPEKVRNFGLRKNYLCPAHKKLRIKTAEKMKDILYGRASAE